MRVKVTAKKPQNTQAESKSGVSSGVSSGVKTEPKSENTNLAKAQKIYDLGYSKRELSTLQRLSSQELDFILREKRDPEPNEISKKTIESSKEVVRAYIESLEAIKQTRCDEGLNKGLVTLAQSNSTALSEFVSTSAGSRVGLILLILASVALTIDSIVGFDKVKKIFGKKTEAKEKEAQNG